MKLSVKWFRVAVAAVVMAVVVAAFAGIGGVAGFLHVQFGPVLLKCLAAFSLGTLAAALVIAAITVLFGRVYCAVWCPLGIVQDVIGFLVRRGGRPVPDFRKIRCLIAGLAFGTLLGGWPVLFLLLDPYSDFGRLAGSFTLGGVIPLVVIAGLAIWKKRVFCTTVCPVGALLGLLAGRGVFRLTLSERCVKCGACVKVCPAGCIDPVAGTLDNGRCLRCLNCVAACRFHAVKFGRPIPAAAPADPGRRAFLISGGLLLGGLAAGAVLARAGLTKITDWARRFRFLPPGAETPERFAARCTACQLCTANCPAGIIVPAPGGTGPVSLDFSRGACQYDCNRCSQVCPTGALRPLPLEVKQRTRIALAGLDPRRCIVFQDDIPCDKCAAVCPTGAVTLRKTGAPRLDVRLCIGCGACRQVCPAPEKAMTLTPVDRQTRLDLEAAE